MYKTMDATTASVSNTRERATRTVLRVRKDTLGAGVGIEKRPPERLDQNTVTLKISKTKMKSG